LALGVCAFAPGRGAGGPSKIAVGGPIEPAAVAAFGAQLKQGVEQAVEDINAKGGNSRPRRSS